MFFSWFLFVNRFLVNTKYSAKVSESHRKSFQINRNLIQWQLFLYSKKFWNHINFFLQYLLRLCRFTLAPYQICTMVVVFWLAETDLVLIIFTIYKSCHCIKFLFNWKDSPWFSDTEKHWISLEDFYRHSNES